MLMSSTLARDSSSVLRSRPIGLPRYQEKEKSGPRMPPPASHWQPTEFLAVLSSPVTLVSCVTASSLTPPHCGKKGPCLPSLFPGVDETVAPGLLPPELEQPATAGSKAIKAITARASVLALRRTATRLSLSLLLVHRMHCSGTPGGQPPTRHLIRHFGLPRGPGTCNGVRQ